MSAGFLPSSKQIDIWFIDLGATQHMYINWNASINYVHKKSIIYLEDSTPATVEGRKYIILRLQGNITVTFTNVLHVPVLTTNLLPVSELLNKGCKVYFEKEHYSIYRLDGTHLTTGKQEKPVPSSNVSLCSYDHQLKTTAFNQPMAPTS